MASGFGRWVATEKGATVDCPQWKWSFLRVDGAVSRVQSHVDRWCGTHVVHGTITHPLATGMGVKIVPHMLVRCIKNLSKKKNDFFLIFIESNEYPLLCVSSSKKESVISTVFVCPKIIMNLLFLPLILQAIRNVLCDSAIAKTLGITSQFTKVEFRQTKKNRFVFIALTEQFPCSENEYKIGLSYQATTKGLLVVLPVHVYWKDAPSMHEEENVKKILSLVMAIISTIKTTDVEQVTEQVTIVFAGDWNNCAVHKTNCGNDSQGTRTIVHMSDEEKTRRGVVGFMAFGYDVNENKLFDRTSELRPKCLPTGLQVVEDPSYQKQTVLNIIGQKETIDETSQKQIVDFLFSQIPAQLLKGDHPSTMVPVADNKYIAIHAMLGFGKGGFNVDPLYGMFLRKKFLSLLPEKMTLPKKKRNALVRKLQNAVTEKVCEYFKIPYSEYPFTKAENQYIFEKIFLKQKHYIDGLLLEMIHEFDSLPTE